MRWLLIVLIVSVVALLVASGGVAHHIWREHRSRGGKHPGRVRNEEADVETEEAHEP